MFDEIKKYKNNGHFFFRTGDKLNDASKAVPELPGVYYIARLSNNKIDLVFIGKSGTVNQNGNIKGPLLKELFNNNPEGKKSQQYFEAKISKERIDALDIYWFVTMDKTNHDLPGYVQGLLMQRFFDLDGRLPMWNKSF